MNDENSSKQRALAIRIVNEASPSELEILEKWVKSLMVLAESDESLLKKLTGSITLTANSQFLVATARLVSEALAPEHLKNLVFALGRVKSSETTSLVKLKEASALIYRSFKLLAWDDRSLAFRLGSTTAIATMVLFGGQGAGIAALGSAIGLPLWVVFGAGASFLGILYQEINRKK